MLNILWLKKNMDETDDIQEDWKNAFLSESTGVSVGTTHTDNHLRPATNPAV